MNLLMLDEDFILDLLDSRNKLCCINFLFSLKAALKQYVL